MAAAKTYPDASPMKGKGADHSHLGYQAGLLHGGRHQGPHHPGRPGCPLRGHREQTLDGHTVEDHLQTEKPIPPDK
jgi:hypothetical protein